MYYKPKDENALRHFFTKHAEEILKIEYFGPIIDENDRKMESPDCYILDKRGAKPILKRCEFKGNFSSSAGFVSAFSSNGKFDIAIVWEILGNKERNRRELKIQNGCDEIIELYNIPQFKDVQEYCYANIQPLLSTGIHNINNNDQILNSGTVAEKLRKDTKDYIKSSKTEDEKLVAMLNVKFAYIFAVMCPKVINVKSVKNYLQSNIGKANRVTFMEQKLNNVYKILKSPRDEDGDMDKYHKSWDRNIQDPKMLSDMLKDVFEKNWPNEKLPTVKELSKRLEFQQP